ncbi:related to endo-1,4-beta-xylanase [Rhynchosporium secalis]|uniref:Beta-xylanase n=1 Tax=Rhynchosporium secalis TaxID=38038 RepID=A0A1E1MK55_RHYSE|nr:related to endo-1,4-beta-xylanase [Rhynchosporium secalis]
MAAMPFVSAQLHELAVKAGLKYFGTATDVGELSNATYVKILRDKREFGQLVGGNGQKWFATEPQENIFNWTMGEVVSDLAKKDNRILRCHTLVWHSQLAPWVETKAWTKATLTAAMVNHITQVAKHWKGQCYAWDVLNEALNEDGTYRNSTFLHHIGPEYIKIAFRAAAKADPHAKLYYNDYNMERVSDKTNSARKNIVKFLQDDGIRIDGVGMQAHFEAGRAPNLEQLVENMELFADMVDEIAVTELDVRIDLPTNTTNLAQQAVDFANTVDACLQVDACIGVTVWDFYDPFSWIPDVFRGQGAGTLWFPDFSKHPAYNAIIKVLKKAIRENENDHPHHPHGPGKPGKPGKRSWLSWTL